MKKYIRKSLQEKVSVCAIKASADSGFKDYKKSMLGLPQNIFSLAACTPEWATLQMVDETVGVKVDWQTSSDIVVIMFHTPDAIKAYEIADKFKKKGKTVVLGGLHTSFMQEEALGHADAIMIGECEDIWHDLLEDYLDGRLKKRYERDTIFDLSKLKSYPTDILPTEIYDYSWTVTVSRGCPNKCSYCTVNKFFPSYRKRPIADIVEEIKNAPTDFIELKADNLTVDRNYCLELFEALEPLNIIWMTALEPEFAEDKELVKAAVRSGMRNILLGIETPSREVLKENNKGHLQLEKLKDQIAFLHSLDVEVDSAMLFGFDDHDQDIFKETLDFALDIDLDVTHGVVPIPFPGTDLYKKLDEEGRLTTKDWSKYDGSWLVFNHENFDVVSLYNGIMWYEKQFNKNHESKDFKWHHRWDGNDKASMDSIGTDTTPYSRTKLKWKSLLAIAMVSVGITLDMPILFGLLYIFWAIQDIRVGHAYIVEDVSRDENPFLFWVIVTLWMGSGLYVFLNALFSNWI